ncbi:MAG: hypothetical protein AAFO69_09555 [Bacteroidota bacterium]
MRDFFNRLLSFFRKTKEFPKPYLGMSWEEFNAERKEVNKLIKVINDHKIISRFSLIKHPNPFFKILDLNKKIGSIIEQMDESSLALVPLRKMRVSCQRFLHDYSSMDMTPSQYHEMYRNFTNTLKIQCAVLINEFWIVLDEELEELEINTSLV